MGCWLWLAEYNVEVYKIAAVVTGGCFLVRLKGAAETGSGRIRYWDCKFNLGFGKRTYFILSAGISYYFPSPIEVACCRSSLSECHHAALPCRGGLPDAEERQKFPTLAWTLRLIGNPNSTCNFVDRFWGFNHVCYLLLNDSDKKTTINNRRIESWFIAVYPGKLHPLPSRLFSGAWTTEEWEVSHIDERGLSMIIYRDETRRFDEKTSWDMNTFTMDRTL